MSRTNKNNRQMDRQPTQYYKMSSFDKGIKIIMICFIKSIVPLACIVVKRCFRLFNGTVEPVLRDRSNALIQHTQSELSL